MTQQQAFELIKSRAEVPGKDPQKLINGHYTFGLSMMKIRELAKALKKDEILADQLYESNNHDVNMLATLIDVPDNYSRDEMDRRVRQLYPSPFAEKFCKKVMAKSPYAVHYIHKWLHQKDSNAKYYAMLTLAELSRLQSNLSHRFFEKHLELIETTIHTEDSMVKGSMNKAIVAIGSRNKKLYQKGLIVAKKIGKVKVNYKGTSFFEPFNTLKNTRSLQRKYA